MNVLLDHCVPKRFGFLLADHHVHTTHFMHWEAMENGELLAAAATSYEVFITTDRNLPFQQHVGELPMAVFSLVAVSNELEDLAPLAPEVLRLLETKLQKRVYVVGPKPPTVGASRHH